MLATARAKRPGWMMLAARRDLYLELPLPTCKGRTMALDAARAWAAKNANICRKLYPGCLLIPINLDLVGVDGPLPVQDLPQYVPMWPKRMPMCGAAEEALGRMRITLGADKDFARRWSQHRFIPVRVDDAVFIPQ